MRAMLTFFHISFKANEAHQLFVVVVVLTRQGSVFGKLLNEQNHKYVGINVSNLSLTANFQKIDVLFSNSLIRQTLVYNFRTRKSQSQLHYSVINDDAPYFCTIDQNLIVYHKSQKLLVPVDIKKDPLYCTLDSTQSSPLGQKVSEWACWAKIINLGRILLLRMLLALEKMAFVSP